MFPKIFATHPLLKSKICIACMSKVLLLSPYGRGGQMTRNTADKMEALLLTKSVCWGQKAVNLDKISWTYKTGLEEHWHDETISSTTYHIMRAPSYSNTFSWSRFQIDLLAYSKIKYKERKKITLNDRWSTSAWGSKGVVAIDVMQIFKLTCTKPVTFILTTSYNFWGIQGIQGLFKERVRQHLLEIIY